MKEFDYMQILNENIIPNIFLFEASANAPLILKDMEKTFADLKTSNTRTNRQKLIDCLIKFTKIQNIILYIDNDFNNAAVLPVYKNSLPQNILDVFSEFSEVVWSGWMLVLNISKFSKKLISHKCK